MARAAALAVCLLALAASAAAQVVTGCTPANIKFDYVAPALNADPMAKCLGSFRMYLDASCAVRIESLQSHGSNVPAIWSAVQNGSALPTSNLLPSSFVTSNMIECPVSTTKGGDASAYVANSGGSDRKEVIRKAFITALEGFVYGFDQYGNLNNKLEVNDLDISYARLKVKRTGLDTLVYAITEVNNVNVTDMAMDNPSRDPITPVRICSNLNDTEPKYDAGLLCKNNLDADQVCPNGTYDIPIVWSDTLNAYNQQTEGAFKICGLCPAGTKSTGYGCTTCPAGTTSAIGDTSCTACDFGTYSNAGNSYCIPCPTGTFADEQGQKECKQCPEDSYSWIPGAKFCMRCTNGIPELCSGVNGTCPSGAPTAGVRKSSPGTHVVSVGAMTGTGTGTVCDLKNLNGTANALYDIKALTKCTNWASSNTTIKTKLAFAVEGECSIQISPITDPTCADPTDSSTYQYGAIQQRAYFWHDGTTFRIRTLLDTTNGQTNNLMLAVDNLSGTTLQANWFPATTDAKEGYTNTLIADNDGTGPQVSEICTSTLTIQGGYLLGSTPTSGAGGVTPSLPLTDNTWECAAGTYYDAELICPICPVGYTCPGGAPAAADKIPCADNTYNGVLGFSDSQCTTCPGSGTGTYTSYAAAQQCAVDRLDLLCMGNQNISQAYDVAAQACLPCPAGTWRNYTDSSTTTCVACPAGSYSAEGAQTCTLCPAGQYNPSEGLPDQTSITGIPCVRCAEGSMALTTGVANTTAVALPGSTFCDACPAGTIFPYNTTANDFIWTSACVVCPNNTYRAGDATPENNECRPVPAGYKLKAANLTASTPILAFSEIELCPKGTVSFYQDRNEANTTAAATNRIPQDGLKCASCAELDGLDTQADQWAHTHAPRKGMTQCIPCPGGTVPASGGNSTLLKTTPSSPADTCAPCPNGSYRDAYTVNATCIDCPAGYEVGPSSKMACVMCRAGTYMNSTMADTQNLNNCQLCPKNTYRPTMGATSCLLCPRGTQTSNTGNVECTACPIGYTNNQAGQDCKPAPAGTFVNTTGAFVTTPCPKGSWNNELAQDNCNPCAPGKYSNVLGAKECKTCPAGTYSAGQASSCINCRAGYAAPAGAAACSPCKPGTYAPDVKSATCKLCPKGFQCPTNAMKLEGFCPKGTFSNKEGNRLCTPCPVNTISQGGAAGGTTGCTILKPCAVMACVKCPPGTNTRGLVGQSRCQVIRPQVRRLGL